MTLKRTRARLAKPGLPPGTLVSDPDALPTRLRLLAYGLEALEECVVQTPEEARARMDRFPVVWLDAVGLRDVDIIRRIGDTFGLHPLALEDAVNVHQRAKSESYPNAHFIAARVANHGPVLDLEQISFFIGRGFLITFQERPGDSWELVRDRIRQNKGRLRSAGPDYLAYALLDNGVDSYYPVLEDYGERLDRLENVSLLGTHAEDLRELHRVKRDLFRIRRAVWPLREALFSLVRDASAFISEETRLHLRDTADHTAQMIDLVETFRELSADLMDLQVSTMNNRMNEVMRVLALVATIFIPITFIASVYGMNFKHMPELDWKWGYLYVAVIMALVAGGMIRWFHRKGWLRSFLPTPPRKPGPSDPTGGGIS